MASGLTTVVVTMFLRIYSESSDYRPITIYRPQCPVGYCALGDYAQATSPSEPNYGVTMCLKYDNNSKLVRPALRFRQIWSSDGGRFEDDEGSGWPSGSGSEGSASAGSKVLALWRAVPPSDEFVGLGDVVTTSYEPPDIGAFCVVHNSLIVTAKRGRRIWLEYSGGVSLWAHAHSHEYLNLRLFVSNDDRSDPDQVYFRSLSPEVFSPPPTGSLITQVLMAKDLNALLKGPTGKSAYEDLSVYVPQPPFGFSALGHYAERGTEKTKVAHVMVVKEADSKGLLAHPVIYRKVWESHELTAKVPFAFWRPIAAPGYHCIGDVATVGVRNPPSTNSVVCLHWSLLRRAVRGYRMWWNRASPLKPSERGADVTVWRVVGMRECQTPNTFVAYPGFLAPPTERLLFNCLEKNAMEI